MIQCQPFHQLFAQRISVTLLTPKLSDQWLAGLSAPEKPLEDDVSDTSYVGRSNWTVDDATASKGGEGEGREILALKRSLVTICLFLSLPQSLL